MTIGMMVGMTPVPVVKPAKRMIRKVRETPLKAMRERTPEQVTTIADTPERRARREARRDSKWKEIDALDGPQAHAWLIEALTTPGGQRRVLRYLFCKLHDKL